MGWLNINGNWIGRNSGKSWSSYCTPQDLVLVAISDTEILGYFTINGTQQDGHKVYISSDNVIFNLLDTLTGTSDYFEANELTTITKYYFRVVAYKGGQETLAIEGNATTLNSAMLAGWDFDKGDQRAFDNALSDHGFHPLHSESAQYFNGKTYIVYQGLNCDPFITYYAHATKTWATPVKIGTNPLDHTVDPLHGHPSMLIAKNGYIHVTWGAHQYRGNPNDDILYSISTNPEDITSWTSRTPIDKGTYPQFIEFSDGTIYIFYRSVTEPDCYWGYKTSTDGGGTWSAFTKVSEDYAYPKFQKGIGDFIHVSLCGNNTTGYDRFNVYYFYFDGTNWKDINGNTYVLPITISDVNILVSSSGTNYVPNTAVAFDTLNNPYILFNESITTSINSTFNYKVAKFDTDHWDVVLMGVSTDRYQDFATIIEQTSLNNFDVYLVAGGYLNGVGGNIEKWSSADNCDSWTLAERIFIGAADMPMLVKNHHSDGKIVFNSCVGDYSYFLNSCYLWGDNGFINKTGLVPTGICSDLKRKSIITLINGLSVSGDALVFGGTNDYGQLWDNNLLSFSDEGSDVPFSISFLLNISGTADQQYLIAKRNKDGSEYRVTVGTNKITFVCTTDGSNLILASAPFTTTDIFVFICCTYDGSGGQSGMKIFINASESQNEQTQTGTYTGMTNTGSQIWLGAYVTGGFSYMIGQMKKLRFWNKVLTVSEQNNVINNIEGW
jgi:hypothetical protein